MIRKTPSYRLRHFNQPSRSAKGIHPVLIGIIVLAVVGIGIVLVSGGKKTSRAMSNPSPSASAYKSRAYNKSYKEGYDMIFLAYGSIEFLDMLTVSVLRSSAMQPDDIVDQQAKHLYGDDAIDLLNGQLAGQRDAAREILSRHRIPVWPDMQR